MFKKAVHYDDLFSETGEKLTEVLHFHLYLSQIIDLELKAQQESGDPDHGLAWLLQQVGQGNNGALIMTVFKDFIKASYGVREGDKFIQSDAASELFVRSAPFDAFLQLILTDEKLATEFVNGIMPRELLEQAGRTIKDNEVMQDVALPDEFNTARRTASGLRNPNDENGELLPWWNREPTDKEQMSMSQLQLADAFRRKSSGWTPPV